MNQFQNTQRPNPMEDMKKFFRESNILPRLIILNVGIWILVQLIMAICFFFNCDVAAREFITIYLSVPASPALLLERPWTLITYMFFHIDFFHILFNMLWLFWFGKIFLQYLNQRQFLITYIFGGLTGAGLFILAYNTLPVFVNELEMMQQSRPGLNYDPRLAMGASASVMAIVTAISFYVPNYSIRMIFIGNIRIFYLAIALFVLDFFMIQNGNAGGHIAHIGGAIYGFLFVYFLRRGTDFSSIFRKRTTGKKRPSFTRKKRKKSTGNTTRPKTDDEYNREKAATQKKIDAILDKISRSGYDSLTKQEKELLFNSSNKK